MCLDKLMLWLHLFILSGVIFPLISSSNLHLSSVQFSSVSQLCLTLCDPMNRSMPGLPVCPSPTFRVYPNPCPLSQWCHPTISSSFSYCLQSVFPSIRMFSSESVLCIRWPKYWSSASASVLPMNIQDLFPLGWTAWISLQSKGLSRVFSITIVQKHRFFDTQLSL